MHGLSKSRYTTFCQCEKVLWLKAYKSQEEVIVSDRQLRLENGNRVGDLAMGLFGPYVEVTTLNLDGSQNLDAMVAKTKEEMRKGTSVICEASFFYEGNYCAVDILCKTDNGWAIYEVKSVTDINSSKKRDQLMEFTLDIAYQRWLLEHCGINVTGTFLVYLDKKYERQGALDLQKLFVIKDMGELINKELPKVSESVSKAMQILANPKELEQGLSRACNKPYPCGFWNYCTRFCLSHLCLTFMAEQSIARGMIGFSFLRNWSSSTKAKCRLMT